LVSGPSALSYPVAFAAGFVSFASPCVLALVPGYLSFISGVSFDELGARARNVLWPTVAFVLGFAALFTLSGASVALLGHALKSDSGVLNPLGGAFLITMGVAMVAVPHIPALQGERRLHLSRRPTTLAGAALAGGAFAVAWSPCISPVLGTILGYAAPTGSPAYGASLLFTYSLGLGIPFLLSGLFFTHVLGFFGRVRSRWMLINTAAGVAVVVLGVLVATGRLAVITQQLNSVGFQGL
jgi:cytochrome c-type biogenesis protein